MTRDEMAARATREAAAAEAEEAREQRFLAALAEGDDGPPGDGANESTIGGDVAPTILKAFSVAEGPVYVGGFVAVPSDVPVLWEFSVRRAEGFHRVPGQIVVSHLADHGLIACVQARVLTESAMDGLAALAALDGFVNGPADLAGLSSVETARRT
jgi:hypothetical protein